MVHLSSLHRPRWEFDKRIDGSGRRRTVDVIVVQLAINWSKWQPLGLVYMAMIYRT